MGAREGGGEGAVGEIGGGSTAEQEGSGTGES